MTITDAATSMDDAIAAWEGGGTTGGALSGPQHLLPGALVQGMDIDEDVYDRVAGHVEMIGNLAQTAARDKPPGESLVPAGGRNLTALILALNQYTHDKTMPPYEPLPLNDPETLRSWRTQQPGQPN